MAQINDKLLSFYWSNGATSRDIMDAEREFLIAQGATPAQLNDMWFEYLRGLGYEGALNDMMKDYWCERALANYPTTVTHEGWPVTHNGETVTHGEEGTS